MNDTNELLTYIETPRIPITKPVRIDAILESRLKEFMLNRRRMAWKQLGL